MNIFLNKIIKLKYKNKYYYKYNIKLFKFLNIKENKKKNIFLNLLLKKYYEENTILISEIKRSSPLKGIFNYNFNPIKIFINYKKNNIIFFSILSEKNFFLGSYIYLFKLNRIFNTFILCKDFIVDFIQIYKINLLKSNCILFIISIINKNLLLELEYYANILGLSIILEVNNFEEIKKIKYLKTSLLGINNRNLKNFKIDFNNLNIINNISDFKLIISESGIKNKIDLNYIKKKNIKIFLIGETLMKTKELDNKINNFLN
ncbi:putative indole-3-glycerol-phosphate synthase [Candidatus Zinderia insecticola CARI]|uniref:indole-3-glycerol-phosphate synthase n=1 Tax=Zinderia insecticola (strain CARI) TaxID=871271 RepID=E0TIM3_ZINIC|nr:putative indole-3-glycerol-phosphate synthase [Candidatus Zinderia insecticola CARI]